MQQHSISPEMLVCKEILVLPTEVPSFWEVLGSLLTRMMEPVMQYLLLKGVPLQQQLLTKVITVVMCCSKTIHL